MLLNWQSAKYRNIVSYRYGANAVYSGLSPDKEFTDDFITAATADVRCPKARIEITWAKSSIDENAVVSSNDINRIDRTGQLFNDVTESGRKWAYLHSGLKADGTFYAAPALDSEPQMGWFGSSLVSDGSGNFTPTAPYIQVTHLARAYTSILIAGDSAYDEYPVDFTITYTHPGGPTIQTITGNTERVYTASFTAIADVTTVKLEITKWSEPNTIVKIIQFAGSLIETYYTDDIVDLGILEETNSDTGIVPIGNVSANELDLSILNTDRRFSYGNTDSPYVASLRSGRKIRVWLGFVLPVGSTDQTGDVTGYIVNTENGEKVGYMPYGVYWSKDWVSSYRSMVTTTTAYDIAYTLSQKDFLRSDNYTDTVGNIIDDILTDALEDIPDLEWEVSADTASINWAGVAFEPKNYLEILKDIAEATMSYSYVNREGRLIIGSRLGINSSTENWQEIDLSKYFSYESNPRLDEVINTIRVGYTLYKTGTSQDIYSVDEVFELPASGTLELYLSWNTSPLDVSTIALSLSDQTGTPIVDSLSLYAYGADLTVTGTPGDTFKIAATGVPYELEENTETVAEDETSIQLYGKREFALTGNQLINTVSQAKGLAVLLIASYGDLRNDGAMSLPATTLTAVGDTLEVVEFKSDTVETKDYFLIKRQNTRFDGSLICQTELRRG